LSEAEARSFLASLSAVLDDCVGGASKNWGVVRGIAVAAIARKSAPQST
jgi:hypothetical protein